MINLVNIAAGTEITINLLEIKENIKKVRAASHATISATKKTGKKIKKIVIGK